jgi:hypothetical protein
LTPTKVPGSKKPALKRTRYLLGFFEPGTF